MKIEWDVTEHWSLFSFGIRWLALAIPVSLAVGTSCALFLWWLELVTVARWQSPWLLWWLPVTGVLIDIVYRRWGRGTEQGNDLILEQIHTPGGGVPLRMAPLVLVGTIATHLCGGSAGREGTAVQMGGSLAAWFGHHWKLHAREYRLLLMVGVAAGFGAVFGTPLAGAIFAIEVLSAGKMSYEALIPCLIAGVIGDWTCTAWGIHHTDYSSLVQSHPVGGWLLWSQAVFAGVAFGLAGVLFVELSHRTKQLFREHIAWTWLRPVVGGVLIILLTYALGTRDYLGLGVNLPANSPGGVSIVSSFQTHGAGWFSWAWKILFTVITLSSGFKGGEVTPLFFIGATLGNTTARIVSAPTDLFAALGFVGVFAGATNTPIACTIMGIELFGSEYTIPLAIACFCSYLFSGHRGIYSAQRRELRKHT